MRLLALALVVGWLGCGDDVLPQTGGAHDLAAAADLAPPPDLSDFCATAGCAPPPICGQPCGSVCGCCQCGPGDPSCDVTHGCIRPTD